MDKRTFNKRIGKNIKRIRVAQGITQTELADGIDVIATTISKIERGLYTPPLQMFYDICEFMNASPNEIFFRDEEFREWKEENLLKLTDYSITGLIDWMEIIEDTWAQVELARENFNRKDEEFHLDSILQMCLKAQGLTFYREKLIPNLIQSQDQLSILRELANNVYRDWLNNYLDKLIFEVRSNKVNNLKIKARNQ